MSWHTLFFMNCFGIELVLCDLYLKRFDLTKSLLFDTFFITDLAQFFLLWSLSIGVPIILTTNELVDRIEESKSKASKNDWEEYFLKKMRRRPVFFMEKNAPQATFFDCISMGNLSYCTRWGGLWGLVPDLEIGYKTAKSRVKNSS
jgi:hypothetical protein